MVWLLLGFLSTISSANVLPPYYRFVQVPFPDVMVVLECKELARAVDEESLEKEIPNLRVYYFEAGYERVWMAKNGDQKLKVIPLQAFERGASPDFWSAQVNVGLPENKQAIYKLNSFLKSAEKNGEQIHLLEVYREGSLKIRMACRSLQSWL